MKIYNTLSRSKEEFRPLKEGCVGIYACGPTVYNYFHIGNARPFVVFDTLRNYLEYLGYKVKFVQNFTDVDDKMIARAQQEGVSIAELAERYIAAYFEDAKGLNVRKATVHPRATGHIGEIIALIRQLIDKGLAYESGGDVYYNAKQFKPYGRLSGQPLQNLELGARIEPGESKRDPMDFALWKAQKPGEIAWDSPWGKGRPGWHIECSAMSQKYLGDTFDIHGGGQDLIFPHHENEIAQSEGAKAKPFAKYWMHNGYINIDNKKMSKSEGNFFTVRDIAKDYDLMAVRLFLLSAHYRSPINFSREQMEQSKAALARLRNAYKDWNFILANQNGPQNDAQVQSIADAARAGFRAAMDDDLNTADALSSIFDLIRAANIRLKEDASGAQTALEALRELCGVLGIILEQEEPVSPEVAALLEKRAQARKQKDWAQSDALRTQILELGYVVEDTAQGQKIKKCE